MTATALRLNRKFDAISGSLLVVSIACGLAYLITRGLPAFPGSVVVKGLSVAALALLAFRTLNDRDGIILGVSLLFSSLGDVFLGLGDDRWFVFGLGSFLIAHLLYIGLFVRHWPTPFAASLKQKLLAVGLIAFSLAMFAWLWPGLGDLKIAVAAYLCALVGMGVTATFARFSGRWIIAGALLFILSDSMIAVCKFKSPVAYSHYLIWATYYIAQLCIALGFIREKRQG
jgi:uncharacterized membrane protein YhhN